MLQYPQLDPIAFQIGGFAVHWYGLMYLLGFLTAWSLGMWRARKPESGWTPAQVGDLIFYCAIGVLVGGRLGYVLFYDLSNFLTHPLSIFKIWQGGMAFHGGLIGVMIAVWFYGRRHQKTFFEVGDFLAPLVPIGLGFGRIGNFINGELWGRITDMPWGMVFPNAGPFPRHPSQLYEALLEGLVLFLILWIFSAKRRPTMSVSGLFLMGYGIFRIFIEFFRNPDWNVGYIAFGWLTEGQLLSLPMILLGAVLFVLAYRKKGSLPC